MDCIDNNKYLGQDRTTLFHCPAAVSQYGYATNAQLSGKSVQITESNDVVLLFETDSPKRNANGTKTSLARPRHHMLNCAFCDGSVAWVNLYTQNRWKWTVPKP
jgi:prepilin-type processing-associated H-X9-DG protein